ncbi:MAG TPA: type II toxin-antitoxin system VapC family toxin [Nitrososphaera sp.]|jgi:predicted nucleic acid-binding protein
MGVCADTDFLIDLKDRDAKAIKKIEDCGSKGEIVSTTAINVAEFYYGVYRARDKETALAQAHILLEPFDILSLTFASAKLYGELAEKLRSKTIGQLDLLIASIVLVNKHTLLTRNVKHFQRVPELIVESW